MHDAGFGRDTDGKRRRNVDADVLLRKGVAQVDIHRERGEIEELAFLEDRPNKRRAAVNALRRSRFAIATATDFTVDDHDFVGWASTISLEYARHDDEQNDDANDGDGNDELIQKVSEH